MSDDQEFLAAHAGHLAAADGQRGPCPDNETLIARSEGTLAPADAATVDAHARLCETCTELLARLATPPADDDEVAIARVERNLERRALPWRGWRVPGWAIGAAAALLAAVLLVARPGDERPPPVERGGGIELGAPIGTVTRVERFQWGGSPVWSRYRVEVEIGSARWTAVTETSELPLPADLEPRITRDGRLRWRVIALGPDGGDLASSAWAEVTIAR